MSAIVSAPDPSWTSLVDVLADLEQQAEALYDVERSLEVADRARAEYLSVRLAGRLMASVGTAVALELPHVGWLRGELVRVTATWCHLRVADRDWVLVHDALGAVVGASDRALPEVAWSPLARLGPGSVLRRLAGTPTVVRLQRRDGGRLDGIVRRVGADFVELVVADQPVLVPLAGVAALASREA